jgi:hypothetical protein
MEEKPYIKKRVSKTIYLYNPKYGDDRICKCGHPYYRHFDSYSDMETVGCKYCSCYIFIEEPLTNCHDCAAKPGQIHQDGCDVERCSVCGFQRLSCSCKEGHDKEFAKWTGHWPGSDICHELRINLNDFYARGLHKEFFVKKVA